jgi:hypothetical protein
LIFLPHDLLDFDPTRPRAGSVWRILPICHNALEAKAYALCHQDNGVGKPITEAQQVALAARQQTPEPSSPLLKGFVA